MEATKKTTSITVQDVPVTIMNVDQRDYISLTDMARSVTLMRLPAAPRMRI